MCRIVTLRSPCIQGVRSNANRKLCPVQGKRYFANLCCTDIYPRSEWSIARETAIYAIMDGWSLERSEKERTMFHLSQKYLKWRSLHTVQIWVVVFRFTTKCILVIFLITFRKNWTPTSSGRHTSHWRRRNVGNHFQGQMSLHSSNRNWHKLSSGLDSRGNPWKITKPS